MTEKEAKLIERINEILDIKPHPISTKDKEFSDLQFYTFSVFSEICNMCDVPKDAKLTVNYFIHRLIDTVKAYENADLIERSATIYEIQKHSNSAIEYGRVETTIQNIPRFKPAKGDEDND